MKTFEEKVAAAAAAAGARATVVASKPGTGTVTFLRPAADSELAADDDRDDDA